MDIDNLTQTKHNFKIPKSRKKNYITLDEYKKLIREGVSPQDMCSITSKHLVTFYVDLFKGKIQLTKEDFEKDYINGLSLNDIAEKYNVYRGHLSFLRDLYGIKKIGGNYSKRIKNEKDLSQTAKEIIIGSVLGDGHIGFFGDYREKHSPVQYNYLKWKASFFEELWTDTSFKYDETIDKRSGSLIKSHSFRTKVHSYFAYLRKLFYKNNNGKYTKVIPDNIVDLLTPLSLAVWYMDDGCTSWPYRNGKKISTNSRAKAVFCTDSFSDEEVELLINAIKIKFDVNGILFHRYVGGYPRIKFDCDETVKLFDIIKPYIQDELLYKADEDAYVVKYNKSKQ